MDLTSVVLSLATVLPIVLGLKEIAKGGSTVLSVLSVLAVAVGTAFAFVFAARQRRLTHPLLELGLFASRSFSAALAIIVVGGVLLSGVFLLISQYLQLVAGMAPAAAGLLLAPVGLSVAVGAMFAPSVAARVRPGYVMAGGLALSTVGCVLLTRVDGDGAVAPLVAGMILVYLGVGPSMALGVDMVVGSAPPEKAGATSARRCHAHNRRPAVGGGQVMVILRARARPSTGAAARTALARLGRCSGRRRQRTGVPMHGPDIARLRTVATRSISPENPTGAPGRGGRATEGTGAQAARELGQGWKVSPSVEIKAHRTVDLAAIEGAGRITHIWLTAHPDHWRALLLRAYWDGATTPAIEVPVGDFFGQGWGKFAQLSSSMIAVNPHGGMNSYWPMPFRTGARLTIENLSDAPVTVYYQVTYEVGSDEARSGYLHAQWRRSNPLPAGSTHLLLDVVRGAGQYVGTYLAWGVNSRGWWGEGEMKYYLDDDETFPTICGTGTEDYFGGAWNFDVPGEGYTSYTTPYLGLHQIVRPDGLYESQQRFGMYRWHVPDPIHFASALRVTVQALGWRYGGRYLPRHDDIASTALFYLDAPSSLPPTTPTLDELEIL